MQAASNEPACARSVLYITYDGLTDPLGRSQVLPYLVGLARRGHRITILSFEKPNRKDSHQAVKAICDDAGLDWHPLTYHKRPPILSTALDVALMKRAAARLHRTRRFDLVHCRSYVAALGGLHLKRRKGVPFLFDMRGFWADERLDGRIWNPSNPMFKALYRHVKRLEAKLLRSAGHVISLTEAGKRELLRWPALEGRLDKITQIPCCVDFDHFQVPGPEEKAKARATLGLPADAPVIVYLGSVGSWYLLDEMLDFFRWYQQRRPDARFLFLTNEPADEIRHAGKSKGIEGSSFVIRPASREEVPQLLAAADLGLFFIKPAYSKIASSPTKMAELLGVGLPIIANDKVGDVGEIIAETGCGGVVSSFSDTAFARAMEDVSQAPGPEQIRERAVPLFDHRMGVERYHAIYCRMAPGEVPA